MSKIKVKINSRAPKSLQELKRVAIEEGKTIPHETASNLFKKLKEKTTECYLDERSCYWLLITQFSL